MSHVYLSLKDFTPDPEIIKLIPHHLATYHVILPVAREGDTLTVIMAHPDSPKLLTWLENQIQLKIFPVQGNPNEILATLGLLRPTDSKTPEKLILWWSDRPASSIGASAQTAAEAFLMPCLDASVPDLSSLGQIAHEQNALLTLIETDTLDFRTFFQQFHRSVWLNPQLPVHHILLALQGHSPDFSTIAMTVPLATHLEARLTLLGVAAPMKRYNIHGVATLLDSTTSAGSHIHECVRQITLSGSALKLREGLPEEEIVQEYLSGDYDCLAIAVETRGDFVSRLAESLTKAARPLSLLAVRASR